MIEEKQTDQDNQVVGDGTKRGARLAYGISTQGGEHTGMEGPALVWHSWAESAARIYVHMLNLRSFDIWPPWMRRLFT